MSEMGLITRYEVMVGNIGCVFTGPGSDGEVAESVYQQYVEASNAECGRTSGEPVTLLLDGEIVKEHHGTLAEEETSTEETMVLMHAHYACMRTLTHWLLDQIAGFNACLTGDCEHTNQEDCVTRLLTEYAAYPPEEAVAKAAGKKLYWACFVCDKSELRKEIMTSNGIIGVWARELAGESTGCVILQLLVGAPDKETAMGIITGACPALEEPAYNVMLEEKPIDWCVPKNYEQQAAFTARLKSYRQGGN